jgi:hypothetical protein
MNESDYTDEKQLRAAGAVHSLEKGQSKYRERILM